MSTLDLKTYTTLFLNVPNLYCVIPTAANNQVSFDIKSSDHFRVPNQIECLVSLSLSKVPNDIQFFHEQLLNRLSRFIFCFCFHLILYKLSHAFLIRKVAFPDTRLFSGLKQRPTYHRDFKNLLSFQEFKDNDMNVLWNAAHIKSCFVLISFFNYLF